MVDAKLHRHHRRFHHARLPVRAPAPPRRRFPGVERPFGIAKPSGPPAQIVVAAARPPCVVVAAIAVDPAQPIAAAQHQTFLIALRATMDGGYSWTPRPQPSSNAIVRLERDLDIPGVAYNNLDRTGRRAVMVGGEATQFFVFDVVGAGQTRSSSTCAAPAPCTARRRRRKPSRSTRKTRPPSASRKTHGVVTTHPERAARRNR
jgi:hypothetical protein